MSQTNLSQRTITMVTLNLEVGGLERVVVDMTLALAAKGHNLSVVTLRGGGPLAQPLLAAGIEIRELHCGDGLKLAYARKLSAALGQLGPELVHSHGEAALFYCGLNRLLANTPLLGKSWGPSFAHVHSRHGYEDVSTKGVWRNRLGHAGCDQVVCVSQDLARHCEQIERMPAARLHTVINGVNLAPYRDLPDLPYVPDAPVIGHVARLAPVKNQALLLDAFAQVLERLPDAQLSIVGDGPERNNLENLAQSLGLGAHIQFHGETSDVASKLAATHVFCLSSDSEGTPVSVIEALAAGRPVVATSVGGLPALVPAEAGVLASAGNAMELARALLRVYASEKTYDGYRTGARNAPAGQHDAQAMLSSYLQIYAAAMDA